MKTVADPEVLRSLKERLAALRPDTPRRWGTLTPHELLCHLADATEMVTCARPSPMHDPRAEGTRPSQFEKDRARLLEAMDALAAADGSLEPSHGLFGDMSARDWQRWSYRHTDYHLRQFGL